MSLAESGLLTSQFEKKVLSGLLSCGLSPASVLETSPLGIAVSGGADSVSLLISLSSIFKPALLRVITVDHGIRSEEESGGDARFVQNLCEKLNLSCFIERIEYGKIENDSRMEGLSIESLARDFRYSAFESFIKNENLCALALAHNQNDQTETLLMRFLQGSSLEGLGGIKKTRGKFIRPLLGISREQIESYLKAKSQGWRTDSTNSDTTYLRNKVRNLLVPVLNEHFSGWEKALLSGSRKALADEDYFKSETEGLSARCDGNKIDRCFFYSLHDALKRRLFFSFLNRLGFGGRFPFSVFEEVLSWEKEEKREIVFENVLVSLDSDFLSFSVFPENAGQKTLTLENGFFFVFYKSGELVEFDDLLIQTESSDSEKRLRLVISKKEENISEKGVSFYVNSPFVIRSSLPGDSVLTADGKKKNLSDLFNDWNIPPAMRCRVMVVEEYSPSSPNECLFPRAVLASFLGAKNWIVEDSKL